MVSYLSLLLSLLLPFQLRNDDIHISLMIQSLFAYASLLACDNDELRWKLCFFEDIDYANEWQLRKHLLKSKRRQNGVALLTELMVAKSPLLPLFMAFAGHPFDLISGHRQYLILGQYLPPPKWVADVCPPQHSPRLNFKAIHGVLITLLLCRIQINSLSLACSSLQ